MPGFFDAVKNFKPNSTNKKHFVTIDNKEVLGKFEQTELVKAEKGYKLYKKNPFYVESIGDNGYTWKIKQKS